MKRRQINNISIYSFENLLEHKAINHFVSTRHGGFSEPPYESLNLGFHVLDDATCVLKNRELLFSTIGIPLNNLVTCKQVHEGNVMLVTEGMRGCGSAEHSNALEAVDAMITDVPDVCLMVVLADCVPVFLFEPAQKVIGIAHAGWRGTVQNVAYNTVEKMKDSFGCQPDDIIAAVGPSIGPCHYEVGFEVIERVKKVFPKWEELICSSNNNVQGRTEPIEHRQTVVERAALPVQASSERAGCSLYGKVSALENNNDKGYFNLWEANRYQLLDAGIPEQNIEIAEVCTYCQVDTFFSARHQKGITGRFGAGIMFS